MVGIHEEESVVIEKKVGDVVVQIHVKDVESLGAKYLELVLHLGTAEDMTDIMNAIEKTRQFWSSVDAQPRVVGVKKGAYRIALSLLLSYPHFRGQSQISAETTLHSGSVSHILTGSRGKYAQYFDEHEKKYKLNDKGFRWVVDEVVPELVKGTRTIPIRK